MEMCAVTALYGWQMQAQILQVMVVPSTQTTLGNLLYLMGEGGQCELTSFSLPFDKSTEFDKVAEVLKQLGWNQSRS
jgi:hypothetical protein